MSVSISTSTLTITAGAIGGTSTSGISLPGLLIGDIILSVLPLGFAPSFESVITVNDQIQQYANADFSSVTFTFYLIRAIP